MNQKHRENLGNSTNPGKEFPGRHLSWLPCFKLWGGVELGFCLSAVRLGRCLFSVVCSTVFVESGALLLLCAGFFLYPSLPRPSKHRQRLMFDHFCLNRLGKFLLKTLQKMFFGSLGSITNAFFRWCSHSFLSKWCCEYVLKKTWITLDYTSCCQSHSLKPPVVAPRWTANLMLCPARKTSVCFLRTCERSTEARSVVFSSP